MAGRATAYGDYYKNNSTTPDDTDTITPQGATSGKPKVKNDVEDARKAAIRRRLLKIRKAGK